MLEMLSFSARNVANLALPTHGAPDNNTTIGILF